MNTYVSFNGTDLVASGDLGTVLHAVRALLDADTIAQPLIFEEWTGRQVDFDMRRDVADIVAEATGEPVSRGPGRPRLGVVAREVTLLPRHWDWLAQQSGGASATLRRLVDEARRNESSRDVARRTAHAVGRIMTVVAGDLTGFEEAYRALDAGDGERFTGLIRDWPEGVKGYLQTAMAGAFADSSS